MRQEDYYHEIEYGYDGIDDEYFYQEQEYNTGV